MKRFACIPFLFLCFADARADTVIWKTEPFASNCAEVAGPKLDKEGNLLDGEGDFVLHKCKTKYGPAMWLLYQDSARMSIGFGNHPNSTWLGTSLMRGDWPLEWGGTESNGRFQPRTVTLRFRWDSDESGKSQLVVYKIADDNPACVVAIVDPGPDENVRARQIAGGIVQDTKCDRQPDLLDDLMN